MFVRSMFVRSFVRSLVCCHRSSLERTSNERTSNERTSNERTSNEHRTSDVVDRRLLRTHSLTCSRTHLLLPGWTVITHGSRKHACLTTPRNARSTQRTAVSARRTAQSATRNNQVSRRPRQATSKAKLLGEQSQRLEGHVIPGVVHWTVMACLALPALLRLARLASSLSRVP